MSDKIQAKDDVQDGGSSENKKKFTSKPNQKNLLHLIRIMLPDFSKSYQWVCPKNGEQI